jgi:hypothetical protein
MLKLVLVSLLAIHCNSQSISIGGAGYGRTVLLSPTLNGVSSLGSFGSGSLGYTNYGGLGEYGTQSLYGLRPLGGIGFSSHVSQPVIGSTIINPATYGFGLSAIGGLRPQALNLVSAAHSISARNAVPVSAAIRQIGRTVEYRPVPYADEPIAPQYVVVEPTDTPLHIHFKSRSSTIRLSQEHVGQPGTVEHSRSQDEPSRVIHEVNKPVIQEVREVVQPYRKVTQELQPVIENVHTVVSKGEGERRHYAVDGGIRGGKTYSTAYQPFNTYQTINQQFNPYDSVIQGVNGYHTLIDGYQTIPQTSVFGYGAPQSFGQSAVDSFGRPIQSSFGSFGQSFGSRQNGGSSAEYDPRFTREFNSGFASGQRPGQGPEQSGPAGGNRGPGPREEGPNAANPAANEPPNVSNPSDAEGANRDNEARNENAGNENTPASNEGGSAAAAAEEESRRFYWIN